MASERGKLSWAMSWASMNLPWIYLKKFKKWRKKELSKIKWKEVEPENLTWADLEDNLTWAEAMLEIEGLVNEEISDLRKKGNDRTARLLQNSIKVIKRGY